MDSTDLAAFLYASQGAEGLRGHPLYESAKALEDAQARSAELWRGFHSSDRKQYDLAIEKLHTTQPVTLIVPCFTREHARRLFNLLAEESGIEWDRLERHQRMRLSRKDGTQVTILTEESIKRGVCGVAVDHVVMHEDTTWRVYLALAPCARSVLS